MHPSSPSPKTLVLTSPQRPIPPPPFFAHLQNLHRHRRCRRPPASIFPICRVPSHKSNGLWMMCQRFSRPPLARLRRGGAGETSITGGSGVVLFRSVAELQQRRTPHAAGGCWPCRGIQSRLKPACFRGCLKRKNHPSKADLATWDSCFFFFFYPGGFVTAPPCSTLQVEEDETVGAVDH